jgi:RiboL-PSP-HEPN
VTGTAEAQFQLGVVEVQLLLGLANQAKSSNNQQNTVRRAAVVLLVSHFESFLKTIAEDYIDALAGARLESRYIPRGIRELHTIPRLREIVECGHEDQRSALLKKLVDLVPLWTDNSRSPASTLKSDVLSRIVTNAQSETIDKLFSIMGFAGKICDGDIDVASPAGEPSPMNIRYGLRDVVQCRNDIAHGNLDRIPTNSDIERYLDFLVALTKRLHRRADMQIEDVILRASPPSTATASREPRAANQHQQVELRDAAEQSAT